MKRHMLVVGDLYIDHDIFVTELGSQAQAGTVEHRFDVVRRQDTAGGAANCARILSVLNDGDTYLWGCVGSSQWGSFRAILEKSHAIDGAHHPVELRGVRDDTDPWMNTITRILVVNEDEPLIVKQRFCRYYDVNHVHITEAKRETLLYHLGRIQEKSQLHAIVINDFQRGTLTRAVIEAVAACAGRYGIPLFVDPRYDRSRYAGIKGTAILPNLGEWCELVDDRQGPEYWRKNLNEPAALRAMAVQSFRHLGNFEYHVIKCDKLGTVLFFPDENNRHLYAIYRIAPLPLSGTAPPMQVACGDVLTAAFAYEFPQSTDVPGEALRAFTRASAAVASYREMPWHQMPPRHEILKKQEQFAGITCTPTAQITKGVLFLPRGQNIIMSTHETAVAGLFSQDTAFKKDIQSVMKDVTEEWTAGSIRSLVLGAPPGTGKTTIMNAIRAMDSAQGITLVDMSSTEDGAQGLHTISPAEFRTRFRTLRESADGQRVMITVDEALREPTATFLRQNAPTLLNAAHAEGVRFLFISAGFTPELERDREWREFFGRARAYYLSNLEARPFDIPYIIAARFFEKRESLNLLVIAGNFLLAVTDLALETPEPRMVCEIVDDVLKTGGDVDETELKVTLEHLPERYARALPKGDFGVYEFRR